MISADLVFCLGDGAPQDLAWLAEQRTREHALNVLHLLFHPEKLKNQAGKGLRQGYQDAGPLKN